MARDWRDPEWQARAMRMVGIKRNVQKVAMGLIVAFIVLSFFVPPEIGRYLFPLVLLALAAYTIVSGFVAHQIGYTGIGAVDSSEKGARWVGIIWLFAGFFLAIFSLSYFLA